MTTKLISLSFTVDQRAAIEKSIAELENQLQGLASLSITARRSAMKMGPKSEAFCRETVNALVLNPQIVPPSIPVAEAQANLDTLDEMRPLFARIGRLAERIDDTVLALGADAMTAALQGYGVLKTVGRSQGLDSLRKNLGGRRFKFSAKAAPEAPPAA